MPKVIKNRKRAYYIMQLILMLMVLCVSLISLCLPHERSSVFFLICTLIISLLGVCGCAYKASLSSEGEFEPPHTPYFIKLLTGILLCALSIDSIIRFHDSNTLGAAIAMLTVGTIVFVCGLIEACSHFKSPSSHDPLNPEGNSPQNNLISQNLLDTGKIHTELKAYEISADNEIEGQSSYVPPNPSFGNH